MKSSCSDTYEIIVFRELAKTRVSDVREDGKESLSKRPTKWNQLISMLLSRRGKRSQSQSGHLVALSPPRLVFALYLPLSIALWSSRPSLMANLFSRSYTTPSLKP